MIKVRVPGILSVAFGAACALAWAAAAQTFYPLGAGSGGTYVIAPQVYLQIGRPHGVFPRAGGGPDHRSPAFPHAGAVVTQGGPYPVHPHRVPPAVVPQAPVLLPPPILDTGEIGYTERFRRYTDQFR